MANSTSAPESTTTAPPDSRLVAERLDFWARQVIGEVTTCGYFNGDTDLGYTASPLTCGLESSCLSDTSRNIHYCGIPVLAVPPTACLDSTAYVTACGRNCQGDLSTKKCTEGENTYCATMYWNSPFGTNSPMSEFNCTTAVMTLTVTSAVDVSVALSTAASIAPSTSNGASITSHTSAPASPTESASSSSSSGLSHNDIIYIVVAIVGFAIVVGVIFGAIRRWRKPVQTQHPGFGNEYRYPLDTRTHTSESTWPTSYTPTTVSTFPGSRSEILPDDSVSQVHIPAARLTTYTQLYSHAPTGSAGL
ncbi:uncharacterized protein TRUGW13939_04230 [Talaromyces rugulosus]|uniref:Mid2 domain-containing protein n=1 Tax=Talaromyces rugulosus TaxID=121627 RepID=A0A7H8QT30_TALRU|nr:uncharacterized protein TRUGW13939_04230 [Talaromyces rugulosus]QKX57122.1 hypothetical protein TRUGW13939_04230 [Talaromyces rugulosus]